MPPLIIWLGLKFSHSLLAAGTVRVKALLYLAYSIWKADPNPLLSLHYPSLIRNRYQLTAGLTDFSSCQMANTLHKTGVILTTRPWPLSGWVLWDAITNVIEK